MTLPAGLPLKINGWQTVTRVFPCVQCSSLTRIISFNPFKQPGDVGTIISPTLQLRSHSMTYWELSDHSLEEQSHHRTVLSLCQIRGSDVKWYKFRRKRELLWDWEHSWKKIKPEKSVGPAQVEKTMVYYRSSKERGQGDGSESRTGQQVTSRPRSQGSTRGEERPGGRPWGLCFLCVPRPLVLYAPQDRPAGPGQGGHMGRAKAKA